MLRSALKGSELKSYLGIKGSIDFDVIYLRCVQVRSSLLNIIAEAHRREEGEEMEGGREWRLWNQLCDADGDMDTSYTVFLLFLFIFLLFSYIFFHISVSVPQRRVFWRQ
tara:strand:+ start:226 stop:555 length:330 start_codon:yes stop_codon:yes gene_type:complete